MFRYHVVGNELVYSGVIAVFIAAFILDGFRLGQGFTL